jgi:hypothetical protein
MNDAKVIDRIVKLLKLAEGGGTTPAESATAAAQASRLMLKYHISQAVVDGYNADSAAGEPIRRGPLWEGGRIVSWVLDLAGGLSRLHGCRVLINRGRRHRHSRAKITLVGREGDAEIVRYLLTYLMREINRLAQAVPTDRAYRNAFRRGAAKEVVRRMRAERKSHREEICKAGHSRALVLVDRRDVSVQKFVNGISTGTYNSSGHVSSAVGLDAGRAAGRTIAINEGISKSARPVAALGGSHE